MAGLGFYIILLLTGFIFTMFLRIRFEVEYTKRGSDDNLIVRMSSLWGLVTYRTEVPIIDLDIYFLKPILKMEADIESVVSDRIEDKGLAVKIPILTMVRKFPVYMKQGIDYFSKYKRVLKRLLKTVRCHNLNWTTEIGLDDPANTGIATGLLWGMKGFLYRVFQSNVGKMLQPPSFAVIPSFNGPGLRLDFNCIFDMRIGHIIIAGLQIVKIRYKP